MFARGGHGYGYLLRQRMKSTSECLLPRLFMLTIVYEMVGSTFYFLNLGRQAPDRCPDRQRSSQSMTDIVPPSPIQVKLAARLPPARGQEIADKVGKAQAEAEARANAVIQERVLRVRGDVIMRAFNAEASRAYAEETKKYVTEASMAKVMARRAEQHEVMQQQASFNADRVELAALRRENAELKRIEKSFEKSSKENDAANKRESIVEDVRAKAAARSTKVTNAAERLANETLRKAAALEAKLAKAEERHAEHLACRISAAVKSYTPKRCDKRIATSPLLDFLGQQPIWVRGLAQALLCLPEEAVASLPPL